MRKPEKASSVDHLLGLLWPNGRTYSEVILLPSSSVFLKTKFVVSAVSSWCNSMGICWQLYSKMCFKIEVNNSWLLLIVCKRKAIFTMWESLETPWYYIWFHLQKFHLEFGDICIPLIQELCSALTWSIYGCSKDIWVQALMLCLVYFWPLSFLDWDKCVVPHATCLQRIECTLLPTLFMYYGMVQALPIMLS